jgi:hypothetical protein
MIEILSLVENVTKTTYNVVRKNIVIWSGPFF